MSTDRKLEDREARQIVAGSIPPPISQTTQDVGRRRPLRPAGEPQGSSDGGGSAPGPQ